MVSYQKAKGTKKCVAQPFSTYLTSRVTCITGIYSNSLAHIRVAQSYALISPSPSNLSHHSSPIEDT